MKIKIAFALLILLTGFTNSEPFFSGKILYKYKFTDPSTGKDITDKIKGSFGLEQHYYINPKNYKAYYEDGKLMQLYNSKDNSYYSLNADETGIRIDGSTKTAKILKVEKLNEEEEIAGRKCKKIIIHTERGNTTYWYDPSLRIEKKHFKKHNYGNWNKYLEATNGALALKFMVKNKKYIWVGTAVEIKPMELEEKEFELPESIKIKG